MQGDKILNKMHDHLFSPKENQVAVFSEAELKVVDRFKAAITKWYDDPLMSEFEIRNFLVNMFGISESQAYRDIPKIKFLFGTVNTTSKEFHRMRANKMIDEAYKEISESDSNLEVKKAEAKIKAAGTYAKINKLEKDDQFAPRWDEIQIPDYSPTSDVSVMPGLKPIANLEERKHQLRVKLGLMREVEDVAFDEVKK